MTQTETGNNDNKTRRETKTKATELTRKVAMTKAKLGNKDSKERQIVVSHQKSGDDKALVGHGVLAHCLVAALLNSRMYI